ncbi:MAG: PEP-CTERM sorting domain-containing protein, partial [Planctomycetaceae bacterium]|nr:PEP-CTERM sorting domain-containing protein [Planctomycetaceae bacterium]
IDSVGGRYEQDAQVNVVPEPSTAMLLLMGLAAVIRTTTRYRR